jgi:hypothetical protein
VLYRSTPSFACYATLNIASKHHLPVWRRGSAQEHQLLLRSYDRNVPRAITYSRLYGVIWQHAVHLGFRNTRSMLVTGFFFYLYYYCII